MIDTPKVSVIIPVYNTEKYLRECLDSVINQTLKEIEIICVDDGSTDGSGEILEEYARRDERVRVIHQYNQFAGVARNKGMNYASGKYIYFLDSDDYCNDNLLEIVIRRAEETEADIVVFDHFRLDMKNGKKRIYKGAYINLLNGHEKNFNYRVNPFRIMSTVGPVPWNKVFLRSFIEESKLKFEDISSTNDITFAALSVAQAGRISYIEKPLMTYRVNIDGSITDSKPRKLNNVITALIQLYKKSQEILYYSEIEQSVQHFVASNLKFALEHYAGEEGSKTYINFRLEIGKIFVGLPLFFNTAGMENNDQDLFEFMKRASEELDDKKDFTYFPEIIVSLTSYPLRIDKVHLAIETLLCQTSEPKKIILWLAASEFPEKELELPSSLLDLVSDRFVIEWTEDLKSYKKLIPALKQYPDAVIITVDDDLLYDEHLIERLIIGYRRHPECIQCHRITAVELDIFGEIKLTYDALKVFPMPTYMHKLSGGAGCLYPPKSLYRDVTETELFMSLAPTNDDLWFWLMGALNGYKVNVVENNVAKLKYIPGTQDIALCKINNSGENYQEQHLKNILHFYPILKDILIDEKELFSLRENKMDYEMVNGKAHSSVSLQQEKINFYEKELRGIHGSWTYRIGRFITYIPRKLRGLRRCYMEHGFSYTVIQVGVWTRIHIFRQKDVK